MRKYNPDEALLQAWKRKLEALEKSTNPKRILLKANLLQILDEDNDACIRLSHFNTKRERLLGSDHQQGFTWNRHFAWFWAIVSLFTSNAPKGGSRLRAALEDIPIEPLFTELQRNKAAPPVPVELDEKAFENALFLEPSKALSDLETRITRLDFNADRAELAPILERLHALKYRLSSDSYQDFLNFFFEKYPLYTLTYFYNQYLKDPHESPTNQDFIEHELIGRSLLDNFVLNQGPIKKQLYGLQTLIMALAMQRTLKEAPLQKLLVNTATQEMLIEELDTLYLGTSERIGLKGNILSLLPKKVKEEGLGQSKSDADPNKPFDLPFAVLEAMFQHGDQFKLKKKDNLLIHIAHLACQKLLPVLIKKNIADIHRQEMQTFNFLSEKILRNDKVMKHSIESYEYTLDPITMTTRIPQEYQWPVSSTGKILAATLIGEEYTRNVVKKLSTEKPSHRHVNWVINSLKYLKPQFLNTIVSTFSTPLRSESSTSIPSEEEPRSQALSNAK
ncbi:MAG: hypothetical protein WC785_03130 [Tatlockia sp.]|jgi:hypothetical protein